MGFVYLLINFMMLTRRFLYFEFKSLWRSFIDICYNVLCVIAGYHWDTSDWAPNPTLPNITEVPMNEIPDSPSSSHSNESNAHINPDEYEYTDYPDECQDSEYVGDSEYAENECGDDDEDDIDDPNAHLLDPPNYEQILALHGDVNYDDSNYVPQNNYVTHPDRYLPSYQLDNGQSQEELDNGNDDDVIHYGFPSASRRPRFGLGDGFGTTRSGYNTDGAISGIDEMSVSMGGYNSTNASVSDISGLCEIEDSEANLSDNDSVDENNIIKLSNSHTQTQVWYDIIHIIKWNFMNIIDNSITKGLQ